MLRHLGHYGIAVEAEKGHRGRKHTRALFFALVQKLAGGDVHPLVVVDAELMALDPDLFDGIATRYRLTKTCRAGTRCAIRRLAIGRGCLSIEA